MAAPEAGDNSVIAGVVGALVASVPWLGQWLIKRLDVSASEGDALRDDLRAERDVHKADAERWRGEAERERRDRLALELRLNEALIEMGRLRSELEAEREARVAAEARISRLEDRLASLERGQVGAADG